MRIKRLSRRELFIPLVIFLIATLAYLLGWTNVFIVKKVEITGAPNSDTSAKVMQLANIKIGTKLARIEPKKIGAQLGEGGLNWVKRIKISRNWISREVKISLVVREPLARIGSQYVDDSGTVFDSPILISKNLPEISASGARRAISLYLALPSDFAREVKKIVATGSDTFQIQLNSSLKITWGQDRDNLLKVKIFYQLLKLPENAKITHVDLSDPTKPTVK